MQSTSPESKKEEPRVFRIFDHKPNEEETKAITDGTYVFVFEEKPEEHWDIFYKGGILQARKFDAAYEGIRPLLPAKEDIAHEDKHQTEAITKQIKISKLLFDLYSRAQEFFKEDAFQKSVRTIASHYNEFSNNKLKSAMAGYVQPYEALSLLEGNPPFEIKQQATTDERIADFEDRVVGTLQSPAFKNKLNYCLYIWLDQKSILSFFEKYVEEYKPKSLEGQYMSDLSAPFQRPVRYKNLLDEYVDKIEKLQALGAISADRGARLKNSLSVLAAQTKLVNEYDSQSVSLYLLGVIASSLYDMRKDLDSIPNLNEFQVSIARKFTHDMQNLVDQVVENRIGVDNIPKHFQDTVFKMYADCYVFSKGERGVAGEKGHLKDEVLLQAFKKFIKTVDTEIEDNLLLHNTILNGKHLFAHAALDPISTVYIKAQERHGGKPQESKVQAQELSLDARKELAKHFLELMVYNMRMKNRDMPRIFQNAVEAVRDLGVDAVKQWNELAQEQYYEFKIPKEEGKIKKFYESVQKWQATLPGTESERNADLIKCFEEAYQAAFEKVNQSPALLKRYAESIKTLRAFMGDREKLRDVMRTQIYILYCDAYAEGRSEGIMSKFSKSLEAVNEFIKKFEKKMEEQGRAFLIVDTVDDLNKATDKQIDFVFGKAKSILSPDEFQNLVGSMHVHVKELLSTINKDDTSKDEAKKILINTMKSLQRMGARAKAAWNAMDEMYPIMVNPTTPKRVPLTIASDKLSDEEKQKFKEKDANLLWTKAKDAIKGNSVVEEKEARMKQVRRASIVGESKGDNDLILPIFSSSPDSVAQLDSAVDQSATANKVLRYNLVGKVQKALHAFAKNLHDIPLPERIPMEYFAMLLNGKLWECTQENQVEKILTDIRFLVSEHIAIAYLNRTVEASKASNAVSVLDELVKEIESAIQPLPLPKLYEKTDEMKIEPKYALAAVPLGYLEAQAEMKLVQSPKKDDPASLDNRKLNLRHHLSLQAFEIIRQFSKNLQDKPEIIRLRNAFEVLVKTHAIDSTAVRFELQKALLSIYSDVYKYERTKGAITTKKSDYLLALEESYIYLERLLVAVGNQQGILVTIPDEYDAVKEVDRENIVFGAVKDILHGADLNAYVQHLYDGLKQDIAREDKAASPKEAEAALKAKTQVAVNVFKTLEKVGEGAKAIWETIATREQDETFKDLLTLSKKYLGEEKTKKEFIPRLTMWQGQHRMSVASPSKIEKSPFPIAGKSADGRNSPPSAVEESPRTPSSTRGQKDTSSDESAAGTPPRSDVTPPTPRK